MKKILFLCVVGLVIISATACDTSKKNTDKNLNIETKTETETKTKTETEAEEEKTNTETQTPSAPLVTEEIPSFTYTDLSQLLYAKSNLNIRDLPTITGNKIGYIEQGQSVTITAKCNETNWYTISYDGKKGFVSNEFLTNIKPEVTQPATPVQQPPVELTSAFEAHDTGDAELNAICDAILLPIIQKGMTERDKAYAVYKWVTGHVKYRGISDTSSWIAGSKIALSLPRNGNCFAFYCASRGLLTRLGFENVEATSYGKGHYWNMVKVDGSWWHFDTTSGWATERFLWTSKQINEYQYYDYSTNGENIVYNWNPEGCPQTP